MSDEAARGLLEDQTEEFRGYPEEVRQAALQYARGLQRGHDKASHYRRMFDLQKQAKDLGRDIMSGGSGWRKGGLYGAVQATYPDGSRVARQDSWRCHHYHQDDLAAMECALAEVRRLAVGGAYEPCSTGPGCQEDFCRRDWARLARKT